MDVCGAKGGANRNYCKCEEVRCLLDSRARLFLSKALLKGAVAGLLVLLVGHPPTAKARGKSLSITIENDILTGMDQYYTAGNSITWYGERRRRIGIADRVVAYLPGFPQGGDRRLAVGIGHKLFTPKDIKDKNPPPDDHPYAGWAYLSSSLIVEKGWRLSIADISVGAVGPSASGSKIQKRVHLRFTGADKPRGWEHQLHDELGMVGRYTDRYRARLNFASGWGPNWNLDIIPGWSLWAGNVYTAAESEIILRLGRGLPDDYGGPIFHPVTNAESFFSPRRGGWYLYARLVRRLVERNIFLDGNTFEDSRSTEKERYVNQLYAGVAFHNEDMQLSATYSLPEYRFVAQQEDDSFVALQAVWAF